MYISRFWSGDTSRRQFVYACDVYRSTICLGTDRIKNSSTSNFFFSWKRGPFHISSPLRLVLTPSKRISPIARRNEGDSSIVPPHESRLRPSPSNLAQHSRRQPSLYLSALPVLSYRALVFCSRRAATHSFSWGQSGSLLVFHWTMKSPSKMRQCAFRLLCRIFCAGRKCLGLPYHASRGGYLALPSLF